MSVSLGDNLRCVSGEENRLISGLSKKNRNEMDEIT